MGNHTIVVTVNGARERLDVPSNMTLLQMLREQLGLTGTKNGCEAGECGACTVLLDGEPVNSCMMLAVEADGREVRPSKGLPRGPIEPLAAGLCRAQCRPVWLLHAGHADGLPGAAAAEPAAHRERSRRPWSATCAAARATCASSRP
jgi:hypothetical protein